MSASPPLRFLAIVLVGWAAARTAFVAPFWTAPTADAAAAQAPGRALSTLPDRPGAGPLSRSIPALPGSRAAEAIAPPTGPTRYPRLSPAGPLAGREAPGDRPGAAAPITAAGRSSPVILPPRSDPAAPAPPGRWALSTWVFVREGGSGALAAGGQLGGSQAGARLTYRINRDSGRPLALSVRLSAPLRQAAGAEAALGVDWKPARRLPVHILAERRLAIGPEGRSAFAVALYGGIADAPAGPFRIDGYAQAGFVGARSRDPFADGSARLSIPLGRRARLGGGAWASAQPGLSRIDLGPQAALRLPVGGRSVTLAADWRVRVAGNARPGSGPTLTVASDF